MANYFPVGEAVDYAVGELEEYYDSLFDEYGFPVEDSDNPFYGEWGYYMDYEVQDVITAETGEESDGEDESVEET